MVALCLKAAYLTVSRPDETRVFREDFLSEAGVEIPVDKRKDHEARKVKLATWTRELEAVLDDVMGRVDWDVEADGICKLNHLKYGRFICSQPIKGIGNPDR